MPYIIKLILLEKFFLYLLKPHIKLFVLALKKKQNICHDFNFSCLFEVNFSQAVLRRDS